MQHNIVTKYNMAWDIFEHKDTCPGFNRGCVFFHLLLNTISFLYIIFAKGEM